MPKPSRDLPFDPAFVTIERKRFSVTQGEVLVSYDGQRIEQYGDKIELNDGKWIGLPDSHWIEIARREAHSRLLCDDRVILHEGDALTIWNDGSWKHADGRFMSMGVDFAPRVFEILNVNEDGSGAFKEHLDAVLLQCFIIEHMKANPSRYGLD